MKTETEPEMTMQTAAPSAPSASAFDWERYARDLAMLGDGYVCPVCHGQGFSLSEDGRMAYTCACRPVRRALSNLRCQGLDQAARAMTFSTFEAREPWQEQMLAASLAYAASEKPGWLFFGGQSGCGKTHLGTAASVALALRGQDFRYMPWTRAVYEIKAFATDERRSALIQQYIDVPVLYIDDLFKAPPTEADKHIAFEILSARYARDDRPTVISSERTLADLIAIDEALAGRIAERCGRAFLFSIARDPGKNHRFAGLM